VRTVSTRRSYVHYFALQPQFSSPVKKIVLYFRASSKRVSIRPGTRKSVPTQSQPSTSSQASVRLACLRATRDVCPTEGTRGALSHAALNVNSSAAMAQGRTTTNRTKQTSLNPLLLPPSRYLPQIAPAMRIADSQEHALNNCLTRLLKLSNSVPLF